MEVISLSHKGTGKKGDMKKESSLVTKESICATCAMFCVLSLIILCTRTLIFGELGETVHIFFTGVFGYLAYPLVLGALYLFVMGLLGKRLVRNRMLGLCVAVALTLLSLIVHTALTYSWSLDGYVKACFLAGTTFPKATVCGALGGLIVFVIAKFTTQIGAIIILSLLLIFSVYLCVIMVKNPSVKAPKKETAKESFDDKPADIPVEDIAEKSMPVEDGTYATVSQRPGVSLGGDGRPSVAEGFSPFGSSSVAAASEDPPYDSREFLFGGTPADNYRRNLIFDPTARVNQTPKEPVMPTDRDSSYTPSYSGAYEASMNGGETIRPAKVVSDYSGEGTVPRYPERESMETPRYPEKESAEPPRYTEEKPAYVEPERESATPRYEESYLDFSGTSPEETIPVEPYEERGRGFDVGREEVSANESEPFVEETPREETSYRRHDSIDLFSPSNPRVFGDEGENPRFSRMFEEEASRGFEERGGSDEVEEGDTRGGRDGLGLLDDEDPYTLRTDYEEETPARETASFRETRGRGEDVYAEDERGRGEVNCYHGGLFPSRKEDPGAEQPTDRG